MRDFTICFHKFFGRKSLFSLKICSMYSFWIKVDLARKHHCIYFEYQKKPRHLFVYFLSILIMLYINVFLKINLNEFNISSLQMSAYRDCIFPSAYDLMFTFCLNTKFNSSYKIFDSFSPVVHYTCRCFKILNRHYLNFVDAKENYLKKHCRDKDYDVEKFDDI